MYSVLFKIKHVVNKPITFLINFLILFLTLSLNSLSQTIDQRLVIIQNDQTLGGVFSIQLQVKGTSLPVANTLGSATIDVQFNNSHLTYTNATLWAFGSSLGYTRSATQNLSLIRVSVLGLAVNGDGGGEPPGFDIGNTYTSWVQLNFVIQSLATTNLTINNVTNGIGLFENHANEPLTGVINNQTLTAPENIINAPLPVELTSFTSKLLNDKVQLNWVTKTEVNNYGFNVERRINEDEWNTIGFVEGDGTTTESKEYSFSDKDIYTGVKEFQYRLKQIDNDGSFEYSEVLEVEIVPAQFELFQNYPNPFNPNTTIRFSLPEATQLKITIYNMLGELVDTIADGTYEAGYHKVTFDASNLSSGAYIYRIESPAFVQVKKMVLIK
jgi:hypothetical protein